MVLLSTVLLYPSQNAYSSDGRFFAWNALGWALLPDAWGIVLWAVVAVAGSAVSWLLLTRLTRGWAGGGPRSRPQPA